MERPKTPNPRINATGEDSPPQKEPEWQIGQTYKDDAFFLKVIAENHTEKRKHIAIIGEPGAGKTTLLGELADRLCRGGFVDNLCHPQTTEINPPSPSNTPHQPPTNSIEPCRGGFVDNPCHPQTAEINPPSPSNTPHQTQTTEGGFLTDTSCHPQKSRINPPLPSHNENFPICIRLADLRSSTIADYLLNNWLAKALQFIDYDAENVTPEIRKSLKQLFAVGKVWLLLDGVDEMAATSPIEALARIREQLTDWVGKARVVLTCRLNVWDAAISNTMTNFDTYKTLEFEPDDVDKFIRQWFEKASEDEKRRNSGNETFWREQEKRLTRQLKEPGKERIKELVRNPLRLSMLCQSWCVPEQELPETKAALYEQFTTYFFEWKQEEFSKKLRVLKQRDKQQLQQALAKLALAAMESVNRFRIEQDFAIEQMEEVWFNLADELGWLVLVDRDSRTKKPVYAFFHPTFQEYFAACAIGDWHFFLLHQIPPVSDCSYRIFERQWREVILLWLGRGEIEGKQKEEFIDALVNFDDACLGFYEFPSYFLAAAAIAEFQDYSQIDEVVGTIVGWASGYFNAEKQSWMVFFDVISNAAREALQQTQRSKAIDTLVQLLKSDQLDDDTRWLVAVSLGKIDPGNQNAIDTLVQLLKSDQLDDDTRWLVADSLGKIDPGNQNAIDTLVQLLKSDQLDDDTRWLVAVSLGKIDSGNQNAIDALVQLLTSTYVNYDTLWPMLLNLWSIGKGNQKAIDTLLQLLSSPELDDSTRKRVSLSLSSIGEGNQKAIDTLVQLLSFPKIDDSIRRQVAESLGDIDPGNQKAIDTLVQLLSSEQLDDYTLWHGTESLRNIGQGNQKAIDTLMQLLNLPALENDIRKQVAESLGDIDPGNQTAIDTLVELLKSDQLDDDTRRRVAESLGDIDPGNQKAIDTLVELLNSLYLCDNTRSEMAKSLRKIDPGNQKAINALVQLLGSHQLDRDTHEKVAESLKEIEIDKQFVVIKTFKPYFNNSQQINASFYELIWHYTQNLPYPDFYQAWHQDTLTNTATANLTIAKLPQLLAEAINNQPELCSKVKLICIDTHQIIDPENPAPEIYDLMLNQNCPEWQNGYPETMQKLKLYCNYLRRISENHLFFICYDSTALTATPTGFSVPFLTALSKFDGAICVVWEKGEFGLQTFSPSQPDLVSNIVKWIETKILET